MRQFNGIAITYFREQELLLWKIKNKGMPNFSMSILREFKAFSLWVREYFSHPDRPLKFIVSASEHTEVYNMGGDLSFFKNNIKGNDKEKLRIYAHLCIDAIYDMYTSFGMPAISIALLEGNAYGGGFECALAHDYIIAEENVQFCLPERKFNLFPGMGAYSLLSRKLDPMDANMITRGGKIYKTNFFESLGLVEKVVGRGTAMTGLGTFVEKMNEAFNFEYHHIKCKKMINPLTKKELMAITDVWVDACMKVDAFDLRKMEILANAQARKMKLEV